MEYLNLFKDMMKKSPATSFLFILLVASFAGSFIWGAGANDLQTARYFGAITVFDATTDQFIRTITSTFQQIGGSIHLLLNLLGLLVTGPFLERIYGPVKYMAFFLITGIFGSVATLMFSDINVISAGASGSVYGLMGLYLGLVLKKDPWINTDMKNWVWNLIWINIVWTFFMPGISITGHIGGLISGVIIAALFSTKQFVTKNWFSDFVKAIVTFMVIVICASIPKLVWPNTVLPFIQEIRIKAGLPTIYDVPNRFSDELFYNILESQTNVNIAPVASKSVSIENISDNFIEIVIILILLFLVWLTLKRIIAGYKLRKLIKEHRQFQQAKVHKLESLLNQIGNDAIYHYSKQYTKINRKRIVKATEFELQLFFGTIFQKIRNAIIIIIRVLFVILSLVLIALLTSIIYDKITADTKQIDATELKKASDIEQKQTIKKIDPVVKNDISMLNGKVIYGYANIPLETVFNDENFSELKVNQKGTHIFISGTYKYELLTFNKPLLEITLVQQYQQHYYTDQVFINGKQLKNMEPIDFMDTLLSQHGDTTYFDQDFIVYSEEEVIDYLLYNGYVPNGYSVMSYGLEGDDYVIHVYEDMETNTATLYWYYVNQYTLDVHEMN